MYADRILMTEDGECMHPWVMKEDIMKSDQEKQLVRSSQIRKESPTVATRRCIGWGELWDAALNEGAHCIGQMRGLVKTLCYKCLGDASSCPCEHEDVSEDMVNSLPKLNFEFMNAHGAGSAQTW